MSASIEEMRACAWRELEMRRKFYPKWIGMGKITQAKADQEIHLMQAIYRHLGGKESSQPAATRDLFGD
ncbi:MAG: hypothetical protein MRY63_04345 [Neomegalonema sp.]|nr:hypothetical protein [Neomegalonema sp.]